MKYYTTTEAGKMIGISRYAMRRMIESDKIDAEFDMRLRIWYISKAEIRKAAKLVKKKR